MATREMTPMMPEKQMMMKRRQMKMKAKKKAKKKQDRGWAGGL